MGAVKAAILVVNPAVPAAHNEDALFEERWGVFNNMTGLIINAMTCPQRRLP